LDSCRWQAGGGLHELGGAGFAKYRSDPVLDGEGGAGEVLADGDLDAVFGDPHGVAGRLSELKLFQGGLVGGNGVATATFEEVGGVGVAIDAGAVLDPVSAGDLAGLAPFHESELNRQTIAEAADAAFACMASGEF
jgi:hypothetical protein